MGYYAETVHFSNDNELTIAPKEFRTFFMLFGANVDGDEDQVIRILAEHGWEAEPAEWDHDVVRIHGFYGKVGHYLDKSIDAIGKSTKDDVVLYMRGEDGCMWAYHFTGKGTVYHRAAKVTYSVV